MMLRGPNDDRPALLGAPVHLAGAEEPFRLLVQSVKDYAIFLLDPNGVILSWNEGAQRIKGYAPAEIVGKHISVFYPDEDIRAHKVDHELAEAARTGRIEDLGWRVRKDGTRFWASVVITALRDERGELVGFGKVTRDLTAQKEAEEALRQSEERFRLLVDAVQDYALFMLDPSGNVVSWNPGAQRIKGYTASEIVGKHFSVFYPPEDRATDKAARELASAAEVGRFEEEGWRVRKDGSRFWASVVLTSVRRGGELLGFAKVTRDLTARRKAEEARLDLAREQVARQEAEARALERADLIGRLEKANGELADAVRARDDFLTIASHELKTPLYTLGLQLSTGLWLMDNKETPRERLRTRLESTQDEVNRLNRLVSNLLDVSRITAHRLALEPQPLELAALAREIVERDREDIARSGSAVTLDAPAEVHGIWDKLRVDQIFTNLLSNALKYGEGNPIVLRVESVAGRARITVRDEGLGIDAVDQARIFERFERAVVDRSRSGFGLGLWIVKQIVDAMGGKISLESTKGQGSTFIVELPLRTENTSAAA